MKRLSVITILVFIVFITSAQTVRIKCPPKTKLKKDQSLGYLNFRGAELGELYKVKLRNNKIISIEFLGKGQLDETNTHTGTLYNTKEHVVKIDFEVDATADVSADLKAELATELQKEMSFVLYENKAMSIKDADIILKKFNPDLYPVRTGEVYALVNRIQVADSLVVKTKSGLAIDANAKVKFQEYDLQLINDCTGILRITGKQVPAFFEFLTFKALVTTETKNVVGILKNNEPKTKQVQVVQWQPSGPFELDEEFQ